MKKVTIRDVAEEAGVSIATVSRVLTGKANVSEETRQQIASAIRKTRYKIPSTSDRSLLAQDGLLYFIIKSASVNVYSMLLNQQMILAAGARDFKLITSNIEARHEFPEEELLNNLKQAASLGVRGVIISGFSENRMSPSFVKALDDLQLPLVMINRSLSNHRFCRVLTGSERGSFQATQHMLVNGRRHLLMLNFPSHKGKLSGYEHAVSEWNQDTAFSQVQETEDDRYDSVASALKKAFLSDPLIDGILCSADELAAHALHWLTEMGKTVPGDVELIGFNDNLAPFLNPPISSVRVPVRQIAENALDLFLEQEKAFPDVFSKTVLMDPQLILR